MQTGFGRNRLVWAPQPDLGESRLPCNLTHAYRPPVLSSKSVHGPNSRMRSTPPPSADTATLDRAQLEALRRVPQGALALSGVAAAYRLAVDLFVDLPAARHDRVTGWLGPNTMSSARNCAGRRRSSGSSWCCSP